MRRPLVLATLFLFIFAAAVTAQVDKYILKVELDPQVHTLSGSVVVKYYNDSPAELDSLYFLLLPNFGRERNPYLDLSWVDQQYWNGFDPSWMEIKAVAGEAGEELEHELLESPPELQTYSLEDTILRVRLPQPLPSGQTAAVKIEFTTKFPHMIVGDQCYHRDIYTWRFGWHPIAISASALADGRFILPAAWYEAEFTIPEDYVLASGADEQEEAVEAETLLPHGPQTGSAEVRPTLIGGSLAEAVSRKLEGLPKSVQYKRITLRSATPVRSLAFATGPGKTLKRYVLSHNGLKIEVYYLRGREGPARQLATYVAEILDRYQQLYGSYSHKRLVLVDSPASGFWGMAADGFVLLGDSAFAEKDLGLQGLSDRLVEWLLAHELAHQWFGIGAGADLNAENFLSEAFAQYLSISYFEEKYGGFGPNLFVFERPGLLEKLIEHQLGFFNLRQHNVELPYLQVVKDRFDEAIIKPEKEVEYGNWSYIRVYDKGYLVLRALAGRIGQEAMEELIRRAYREYNHRILTVKDLQQLAEEVSGQDLGDFFQNWLYSADFVDYAVEKVRTRAQDEGYLTEISLRRRGAAALPVEVVAVTEDGEKIKHTWNAQEAKGTVLIESKSPVKQVEVDPEELTPDVDRLNNFYPMKLRVITTGENDLPLDSYLLRFDPATQVLEGGTLWHRWWLGQGIGAFAIYFGRGSLFQGLVDLRPFDEYGTIAGELRLELTGFSHPSVGSPARFWEPTDRIGLFSGRTVDRATGEGINYLGASWTRSELMRDHYTFSAEILGYPGFARLSLRGEHRFRLMPHLYLEEEAKLGLGASLPGPLRFTLDELRSFYRKAEEGWVRERYPGDMKLYSRLSLSLPAKREMDYDLAGLAVLDGLSETAFLAIGGTWESLEELDLREVKLEVGLEATVSGRTLGGLFPFKIITGFAYPLLGIAPEDRQGRIYIEVQLPLF